MDLTQALELEKQKVDRRNFRVVRVLEQLPVEEQQPFLDALHDLGLSPAVLSRALRRMNVQVSVTAIRNYRERYVETV